MANALICKVNEGRDTKCLKAVQTKTEKNDGKLKKGKVLNLHAIALNRKRNL